jgi:hypothetical protein
MRLVQLGCENKNFNPFNLIIKFSTLKICLHLRQDSILNFFLHNLECHQIIPSVNFEL